MGTTIKSDWFSAEEKNRKKQKKLQNLQNGKNISTYTLREITLRCRISYFKNLSSLFENILHRVQMFKEVMYCTVFMFLCPTAGVCLRWSVEIFDSIKINYHPWLPPIHCTFGRKEESDIGINYFT